MQRAQSDRSSRNRSRPEHHLTIERCLSQRWKAESAQFREAMRNSRLIAQAEKEGKDLSTIDFGTSDPNAQPQVRPRQKSLAQLLLQDG